MVSLTIAPIPAIIKPHPSTPTGPDKTAAKANAARCVAAKSIAIVCTLTKKGCQLSVSTQRPVSRYRSANYWPTDYDGGSLNVNGTIMRDTYINSLKMFISGTRFSAGGPRLICEHLCKMDGQFWRPFGCALEPLIKLFIPNKNAPWANIPYMQILNPSMLHLRLKR